MKKYLLSSESVSGVMCKSDIKRARGRHGKKEESIGDGQNFYFTFPTLDTVHRGHFHVENAATKEEAETKAKEFFLGRKPWISVYTEDEWVIRKSECSYWSDICKKDDITEMTVAEAFKLEEI